MTSIYSTGTVSVTNGSAAVTGTGTAWAVAGITGGTLNIEAAGNAIPIDTVTDDAHLTGAVKWTGATGTYAYAIVRENSDAASVVDLYDRLARVLVTLSLIGIHPNDSGTIAKRDAISLSVDDKGFLFLHAEQGLPFLFYRWTGTAWEGPFDTRGVAGVGAGGLGLPSPGAANKFPYYTAASTVVLGDITAAGRAILDDADAAAQRATLGALGGALGSTDNRILRSDGTGGVTTQGSSVTLDDGGNLTGVPLIIGGTSPSSSLTLVSTGGVGTSDYIDFLVGNSGGTRAARFTTGGQFVIGGAAAFVTRVGPTNVTAQSQIVSTGSGASFIMGRFSADANGARILFAKSRNTTVGGHTIASVSDSMGEFIWGASNGTDISEGARIAATVQSAPGATYTKTTLAFRTSEGTLAPADRLNIDGDGALLHRASAQTLVTPNSHYQKRQYASGSLPTQNAGDEVRSSDVITAALVSDGTQFVSDGVLVTAALTANGTIAIPPGYSIADIFFVNSTANAVTGGVKIGTTSGATDVVAAQAIGANGIGHVVNSNVLKKLFSISVSQTLFIQAVTSWNSASVKLAFKLEKVF